MHASTELAARSYRKARAVVAPLLPRDDRPASALPATPVEAAVLDATAALRSGDRPAARHALRAGLTRAEPLDAVRPFARADADVRALLVDQLGEAPELDAFAHRALAAARPGRAPVVRLSAREQDVLRELPSLRNLDEIAAELDVSVNTVKSHMRAIYRKLGAGSRRAAVQAAGEHGLLP
ncbi:hypothetical protein BJF78_08530 [Pseudonocardia sp. CNS-139]|nr:hypothetical protein BJF78_08530 [Pseudonocardia sp. CNS-139]